MSHLLRMPRGLLEHIHVDLDRPHAFAAERVGFMFTRAVTDMPVSLATDYVVLADAEYLRDERVGTRIGADAIRRAMQRALDTGEGVFHVHRHFHRGQPRFSREDMRGMVELIPSFVAVAANAHHGGLVLSMDYASTLVWTKGGTEPLAGAISVVGFPSVFRQGFAS